MLNRSIRMKMTEEEYLRSWETVRRMRPERIESGDLELNKMPRTETYAF